MTNPFPRELLSEIEAAALAAWNETQQQAFRYRYSSAGGPCIRQLVFEARGAKNEVRDPRHMLAAACGRAVGEVMEAGNRRLGWTTQEHVELPDCEVLVQGSLDAANGEVVLDYKVVNDKQWDRIKRSGPRWKCRFQVTGYSVSTKRKFWALAYLRGSSIFDKRGKLEWQIFTGEADRTLAVAMANIWETVDAHAKAGTLPPIPQGFTPDRFPCGWCAQQKECWDGGSREAGEEAGTQGGRGVVLDPQSAPADHRSDPPDHQGPQEHAAELRLPGSG